MSKAKTRTVVVSFDIEVPGGITDDQVLTAMGQLIDIGLADAQSTVDEDEGNCRDAQRALRLNIGPSTFVGG